MRPLERSYSGEIAYVQIGEEEIAATANHPFWVVNGEELDVRAVPEDSGLDEGGAGPSRWVCAGDLRVGDIVQLGNGSTQAVLNIRIETQETTVYNMEVAGTHNYYVSGLGVLVHNSCKAKGGTYKLVDKQGNVKRTGKSNDLNRRKGEHKRHPDTEDLDFKVDSLTDDPIAQRGREQIIYEQHPEALQANGGLNKRAPISDRNPKITTYMEAGEKVVPET